MFLAIVDFSRSSGHYSHIDYYGSTEKDNNHDDNNNHNNNNHDYYNDYDYNNYDNNDYDDNNKHNHNNNHDNINDNDDNYHQYEVLHSLFLKYLCFYFVAMSCSSSGSTTQTPGGRGGASVLYTFDNTSDDYFGSYNATPVNSPVYVSPGYNGRGQMILLRRSLSQYLIVSNHMNFYRQSLTVEAWIYPLTVCPTDAISDYMIFTQTDSSVIGQLMWFILRSATVYGAFFGPDVKGLTMIATNQWHHIAVTYDYSTRTHTVYVNGIIGKV